MKRTVGKIWQMLSPRARGRLVRATQRTFTVSVAAVITNERGEVLLLDHVLRPAAGWGVPGGFMGRGEQPHEAVRREVREETGLELADLRLARVRTINRHIEVLFRAAPHGVPEVKSREIYALGWFAPGGLPEKISAAQRAIIADVLADGV